MTLLRLNKVKQVFHWNDLKTTESENNEKMEGDQIYKWRDRDREYQRAYTKPLDFLEVTAFKFPSNNTYNT